MSSLRQSVREYVRASEKVLEMHDLSEEEEQAVKDVLARLSSMFPDAGDDAVD